MTIFKIIKFDKLKPNSIKPEGVGFGYFLKNQKNIKILTKF